MSIVSAPFTRWNALKCAKCIIVLDVPLMAIRCRSAVLNESPLKTNTMERIKKNLRGVDAVRAHADRALMAGSITQEQHNEIKKRCHAVALDNIFSAMAA